MTNPENQKRLDKKKWNKSQELKGDQSGKMDYCNGCTYQKVTSFGEDTYCVLSQKAREENCACATSYNRMVRNNAKRK